MELHETAKTNQIIGDLFLILLVRPEVEKDCVGKSFWALLQTKTMKSTDRKDQAWTLEVARAVAIRLRDKCKGTRIHVRMPTRARKPNTDGWAVVLGNLGKGEPRLEIWFDRFSGHKKRKLYAVFHSTQRSQITNITKNVARKLWPCRVVTKEHLAGTMHAALSKRLARSEFNSPLLEKYEHGSTYYGIYDPTRETMERVSPHFCARAVAFFEDVATAQTKAKGDDEQREVYPRHENRRQVASHLIRERSRLLATECKIRDKYECQVCGFLFDDMYGKQGHEFAEAHHLIPLSRLRKNVRTRLEDLIAVCSNCHSMLHHKMDGDGQDITRLKSIVRRNRKK